MLDAATLAASARDEIAALASHQAVVNGGLRVPVIFAPVGAAVLGVETTGPALRAAELDWPDCAQGDVVDIGDYRYTVSTRLSDGAGMWTCTLHRSA